MKKSTKFMNLFLLNSICSLILLIFMEIFFFLLDGINTFEFINIQERISQMIWCSFFVMQIGVLKIEEVFSKNKNGKQIICIHYLFIIYMFLFPLSSALLFTSALSWTKIVYFTYILSLSTSIKIRGLLFICTVTLITGFLRFYHSMPSFIIILCFTVLLLIHILICILIHIALYILAKQIASIKKKPLCAFDTIEPYFQELEKKAILIRNNLIYCQQNNISVDILGNNLFEYEMNDSIKKIKTINKSRIKVGEYSDNLISVQYEDPLDVSDVNCSIINNFHLEVNKINIQNESVSSCQMEGEGVREEYKTEESICTRNMEDRNMEDRNMEDRNMGDRKMQDGKMQEGKKEYRKKVCPSENFPNGNFSQRKNSIRSINTKGEKDLLFDSHTKNHTSSSVDKTGHLGNNLHNVQHLPSRRHRNRLSKSNIYHLNSANVNPFGKKLDKLNNKNYEETSKKEIIHRHFSLLRSGFGKFHRRKNILLSEELKNKINYIYFNRDGKVKQSKIIPLYVLERHNLSNISTYLRNNNISTIFDNYYKIFTLLEEKSLLEIGDNMQEVVKWNLLRSLRDKKQEKSREGAVTARENQIGNSFFINEKHKNSRYCVIRNNDNVGKDIKFSFSNFDTLRTKKKGQSSSYNHYTSSMSVVDSDIEERQNQMKDMCQNSTRLFYLLQGAQTEGEAAKRSHITDLNAKIKENPIYHFESSNSNNDNRDMICIRDKGHFYVNKSKKKETNVILPQESSDNNLPSSNNAFYIDDVLDESSTSEIDEQSDHDASATCVTFSNESLHKTRKGKCDKKAIGFENHSVNNCVLNEINLKERNLNGKEKKKEHATRCLRAFSSLQTSSCYRVGHMKRNVSNLDDGMITEQPGHERTNGDREEEEEEEIEKDNGKNYFHSTGGEKGPDKTEKKKSNCYYVTKLSLKKKKKKQKKRDSEIDVKKSLFLEFYDAISINYKEKPHNMEKKKTKKKKTMMMCHNWKKLILFMNPIGNILEYTKSWCAKCTKGRKYWKKYNDTFYTSEWKYNMQDNELDYILKYKNFTKWYKYWVKGVLFDYYKSAYLLNMLLLLLNVLTIYVQMQMFYFFLEVDHRELKSPNLFYLEKPVLVITKYNLNNSIDIRIFNRFLWMRIPTQIILNVLFLLPSLMVKNYRSVKLLNIFAILNCLVNTFFGIIDIIYSINSRIYNMKELYTILNYYNMFDIFLVGKLITSIFLIPFITNFNEYKTNMLVCFSCFAYIATFYYAFNPFSFSIKLMYITNFVVLIATAMSTVYYSGLITKSRKMLFVKYVLPYFIYLTFLNTDPNIQMQIKEKRRRNA
ncbi:hypothetical protein, conserved [Plasmodium gonderi]|uniref:Transporter n=1 Tax=Plasmodium gonderi TaxID=77519 RepID=A0A1Y1JCS4_PLAGO|nr:hypothetical protein, conserved [Plasmodium gonderi]GAW80329.1 hypothetical protein, conserved [Plasmodium gonderi]